MSMEISPLIITALRLIHIVAAAIWFGLGAAFALFIAPTALSAGEAGRPFMQRLMNLPTGTLVGITAVLTTVAGLLLYATGSHTRFTTVGNIVLGIGTVAGLLAFGHGITATSRATTAYTMSLERPAEGDPSSTSFAEKLVLHSRISFYLTLVALIGMASARYL